MQGGRDAAAGPRTAEAATDRRFPDVRLGPIIPLLPEAFYVQKQQEHVVCQFGSPDWDSVGVERRMAIDQPASDIPASLGRTADEPTDGRRPVELEALQALIDAFVAVTLETMSAADASAASPLDPELRAHIENIAQQLERLDDLMVQLRRAVEKPGPGHGPED